MTMHGENIGSRKVEPATNDLPKWRLYGNFLLRELARLWYGQKSIFDPQRGLDTNSPFWRDFVSLFGEMVRLFGKEHGLTEQEMNGRLVDSMMAWQWCHGIDLIFSSPYFEAKWRAVHMLGNELSKKLLEDSNVNVILSFVGYAYALARKGQKPPYDFPVRFDPVEYFEALPVDSELEDRYYHDEPFPF